MFGRGVPITLSSALATTYDSIDAEELSYPNLKKTIQKYYPYEYENVDDFYEESDNSELSLDLEHAHEFLLMLAHRIQEAEHPAEKELWTQRYTEASIKVYGVPSDVEVASIARMELDYFDDVSELLGGPRYLVNPLLEEYQSLAGNARPAVSLESRFNGLLAVLKEYFLKEFDHIFICFEDLDDEKFYGPDQVKKYFAYALGRLQQDDEMWKKWRVAWHESGTLSVDVISKKINVGRYRAPIRGQDIKGLFAHEVLIHAQRSLKGEKIDENLALGLPGYVEAEEGFGVLVESAINGHVSPKVKDRYIDVALALGISGKKPMNRRELFAIAYSREVIRNLADDRVFDVELLKKTIWVHVNRLYRGTLGNNYIGVFTKDIAYYKGFCKIAEYLSTELRQNNPVDSKIGYMMHGKFDPCKIKHKVYVDLLLKS